MWGDGRRTVLFVASDWDLNELDRMAGNLGLPLEQRADVYGTESLGRHFPGTMPTLMGSVRLWGIVVAAVVIAAWTAVGEFT